MWKLIEIPEVEIRNGEELNLSLSDGELVGISVALASADSKSPNEGNCYQRAWEKNQPAVKIANDK